MPSTTPPNSSPSKPSMAIISKEEYEEKHAYKAPASDSGYETEEDEDNKPNPWAIHPVDLSTFEKHVEGKPIFTRELFQRFINLRQRALKNKKLNFLVDRDLRNKKRVVWLPPKGNEDDIFFQYLTTVEIHPDYNFTPCRSPQVALLHEYNEQFKDHENEHIPCPIIMCNYRREISKDHLNKSEMAFWRKKLPSIRRLWTSSSSAQRLRDTFHSSAQSCVQIKKIVCIGLGSLRRNASNRVLNDFQEALQHFTAFTIASTLDLIYKAEDPKAPPIQIIAQDPSYTEKDKILLKEGYTNLTFVDDPEGFLAIDEHTLVITAFLPWDVPLVQICADLGRPAGFICDKMDLDPEKTHYESGSRSSPRVVQMLKWYRRSDFDDHVVEKEMFEDMCGKIRYWLWDMDLFLKPRNEEKEG